MADDATDVQVAEISPDDFMADEQVSTKTESSPVEQEAPEAKEDANVADVKPDDTGTETTEEQSEETDTDTPEEATPKEEAPDTDKPTTKADERKAQLNTEIRDLVAQRNALKQEVEKATGEVYQPATEADLMEEGMSATDAKVEALRQTMEVRDYNERVAEAQLTLGSESLRVMNDFPIFNPDSDQFDQELAEEAASLLESNLIRDKNVPEIDPSTGQPTGRGIIIGSNVSPYRFYKTLARAAAISSTQGQLKGQQAQQEMLANADAPAATAPAKKKADPLTTLWEGEL